MSTWEIWHTHNIKYQLKKNDYKWISRSLKHANCCALIAFNGAFAMLFNQLINPDTFYTNSGEQGIFMEKMSNQYIF